MLFLADASLNFHSLHILLALFAIIYFLGVYLSEVSTENVDTAESVSVGDTQAPTEIRSLESLPLVNVIYSPWGSPPGSIIPITTFRGSCVGRAIAADRWLVSELHWALTRVALLHVLVGLETKERTKLGLLLYWVGGQRGKLTPLPPLYAAAACMFLYICVGKCVVIFFAVNAIAGHASRR